MWFWRRFFSFSVLTISFGLGLGLGLEPLWTRTWLGLEPLWTWTWLGLEPLWTWTCLGLDKGGLDYSPSLKNIFFLFEFEVTCGQVWWPILGIRALHFTHPSAHTHSSEHAHTVNTHPEPWAAIYAAALGEQLGVQCLVQGSHLSNVIEGGESAVHSLTIPAGPNIRTHNLGLQVRRSIH